MFDVVLYKVRSTEVNSEPSRTSEHLRRRVFYAKNSILDVQLSFESASGAGVLTKRFAVCKKVLHAAGESVATQCYILVNHFAKKLFWSLMIIDECKIKFVYRYGQKYHCDRSNSTSCEVTQHEGLFHIADTPRCWSIPSICKKCIQKIFIINSLVPSTSVTHSKSIH